MVIVRANEYKTPSDVAKISDGKIRVVVPPCSPEDIKKLYYSSEATRTFTLMGVSFVAPLGTIGIGMMSNLAVVSFAGLGFGIVGMIAAAIYDFNTHPRQIKKIIKEYTPAVIKWLSNHNITVSKSVAEKITLSMLSDTTTSFYSLSKERYSLFRYNDWWKVAEYSTVHEVSNPNLNSNILTISQATSQSALSVIPTTTEQGTFNQKISLLENQGLAPEQQYVVERAKKEAETILSSASTLKQLGYGSYLNKLKESFTLLNNELNELIVQLQEEELDKLNISQTVISERKNKASL